MNKSLVVLFAFFLSACAIFAQPEKATSNKTAQPVVRNTAGFQVSDLAQGQVVVISMPFNPGSNFVATADANGKLPELLAGVKVNFGHFQAGILQVAANAVTAVVPYIGLSGGNNRATTATVEYPLAGTNIIQAMITDVKVWDDTDYGAASAFFNNDSEDGSRYMVLQSCLTSREGKEVCNQLGPNQPAAVDGLNNGVFVTLWVNALGKPVNPGYVLTQAQPLLGLPFSVSVAGKTLQSVVQYVGTWGPIQQINLRFPVGTVVTPRNLQVQVLGTKLNRQPAAIATQ